jgi:glutaminase
LIERLVRGLIDDGKAVAISSAEAVAALTESVWDVDDTVLRLTGSLDEALEWCENLLLLRTDPGSVRTATVEVEDNDLVRGLDAGQIAVLKSVLASREFAAGRLIIRAGDEARSLFLLARGEASVMAPGVDRRLATYPPGTAFGEMAVLGECARTADIRADTECLCYELDISDFARLTEETPALAAAIYGNLARKLAANLAQANVEIAALHAGG